MVYFIKQLINKRKELGLTQEKAAQKIGVTQQAYSLWESGVRNPCHKNIKKICELLNVSPNIFYEQSK